MTHPPASDQGVPPPGQLTPPAAEDAHDELRGVAHTLDAGWKRRFVVRRENRDFILYAGLLDLAHKDGLKEISTTLVQVPSELNQSRAIVHATVVTTRGTFTGLGDADPTNVTRMMAPHLIRMAETRSKARALRDAVNVGMTSFEELGESGDRQDGDREHVPSEPTWGGGSAAPRRVAAAGPAPGGPASAEQLAALRTLMVTAGVEVKTDGLTFAQAGAQIIALQDAARTRSNGASR